MGAAKLGAALPGLVRPVVALEREGRWGRERAFRREWAVGNLANFLSHF